MCTYTSLAFTATEAWRNPTYLEENITMFDQNLIFDEVMREMITVESEPESDDENDEFQDEKEGHSRDGKYYFFTYSSMPLSVHLSVFSRCF